MSIDRPAAERAIDAFLRAIGRDPDVEPELRGTGARVAAAYLDELCAGYLADPAALVRAQIVHRDNGRRGPARRRGNHDVPAPPPAGDRARRRSRSRHARGSSGSA